MFFPVRRHVSLRCKYAKCLHSWQRSCMFFGLRIAFDERVSYQPHTQRTTHFAFLLSSASKPITVILPRFMPVRFGMPDGTTRVCGGIFQRGISARVWGV
ncbi:hypothetical protein BH688_03215 [Kushneria phosphatilytica]|nr:hypothetical protein BH688_03215 [Kushneria phosphatilytica]